MRFLRCISAAVFRVSVIKAAAALNGNKQVEPGDLKVFSNILWVEPEQIKEVSSIVEKHTVDTFTQTVNRVMKEAEEIANNALSNGTTEAGTEANKKLKELVKEIKQMEDRHPSKTGIIKDKLRAIKKKNDEVLDKCLGI